MANRRRNTRKPPQEPSLEPSPHLVEHLQRIGLASLDEYRAWCRARGFPEKTDKTSVALRREREEATRQDAQAKIALSRRFSDPIKALALALEGSLDLDAVGQADLHRACTAVAGLEADRPHRGELLDLLAVVHRRARFLLDEEVFGGQPHAYIRGLIALNDRRGQWVRSVADWRPRTHNRRRQFSSLARHLTAEYPVPAFMDSAWMRTDRGAYAYRDLFVHIGRGLNPRAAKTPVPLTRKEAHHFLQAPQDYSIEGAVRWGQIHALGGGSRLADALTATAIAADFGNDRFWQSVVRFFVNHPLLDRAQVGPLIDYINHCKYVPSEVVLADGSVELQPPPQPGFSMARRMPGTLLVQMERWHKGLGRGAGAAPTSWPSSGIGELRWRTGQKSKTTWIVRELRSHKALQIEGRSMGHCVVTYTRSCAAGRCSIWALERSTPDALEKRQTVEVSRQGVIVQSRGKRNVLPGPRDLDVLRRWAAQEELTLASYL